MTGLAWIQEVEPAIWRDQPRNNRHVRAFVRYCRRRGDHVRINMFPGFRADIYVWRKS